MTDLGYCRLCAEIRKTATLIVINKNENDSTTNLCDKIVQCFQIQILSDDMLPKTVCLECCTQMNVTYEFYLKVQKAQEFLRNIICNPTATNRNSDLQCNSTHVNKTVADSQIKSELISKIEISEPSDHDNSPSPIHNENIEVLETDSVSDDENGENNHISRKECKKEDSEVKLSKKLVWKDFIWKCTKCLSEFKTNNGLVEHFQNEHAESPEYRCPKCSKICKKYCLFSRHLQVHENQDKYRCDICHKTFHYNSSLKRHLNVCHEQDPQLKKTCNVCGKEFKNPSSFEYHTKYFHMSAEDKLRFECDICKKRVTSKSSLTVHKKVHDDSTKDNICDRCGVGFRIKSSLKYHIENVHKQINIDNYLSCSLCPAKLKHKMQLRRHIRQVHSDKRFECEICGKQFYHLTNYTEHLRKHTGERPFQCQHCNKRFRLKVDLENHTRQHTGEKPYCCTDCNHDFTDFSNYIKHMRRKHGVTSFKNVKKSKSYMNSIF